MPTTSLDDLRFRPKWSHACCVDHAEIELWIARCPHCGMPAPPAFRPGNLLTVEQLKRERYQRVGRCTWPRCANPGFCESGNFGNQVVCREHFMITNGRAGAFGSELRKSIVAEASDRYEGSAQEKIDKLAARVQELEGKKIGLTEEMPYEGSPLQKMDQLRARIRELEAEAASAQLVRHREIEMAEVMLQKRKELEARIQELEATLAMMGQRDGDHLRRIAALETDLAAADATIGHLKEELDRQFQVAEEQGELARTLKNQQHVRLAKLDALLASEEPPIEFVQAVWANVQTPRPDNGRPELAAWRWFREKLGS